MKNSILKRSGYILLLIAAQTVGLYFAVKPEKSAVAADLPTDEQIKAKDAAVTQCRVGGQGLPVMGYGFKVICVKRDAVLWIR